MYTVVLLLLLASMFYLHAIPAIITRKQGLKDTITTSVVASNEGEVE